MSCSAQGEVCNLQSERDGLLRKLSTNKPGGASAGTSTLSRGGRNDGGSRTGAGDAKEGAAFARMKARVAELEARIKDSRSESGEGPAVVAFPLYRTSDRERLLWLMLSVLCDTIRGIASFALFT